LITVLLENINRAASTAFFGLQLALISFVFYSSIAHAGFKDWSTEKQIGFVVEYVDTCQQYAGLFRDKDSISKVQILRRHYGANSQFESGVHAGSADGYASCTDCEEKCSKHKNFILKFINIHSSKISKSTTKSISKPAASNNTRTVPFAVHWENKRGVLLGSLEYPKAGASGSLKATAGKISCQGTFLKARSDSDIGTWSIACSDGRTASGSYKVNEPGKGTGEGTDPNGNRVEISWGG
jgi:hypothetical protein